MMWLILVLIFFSCTQTITEVEFVEVEKESDALGQVLRQEYPDFIIAVNFNVAGDSVVDFTTTRSFVYSGDVSMPVSLIRGVRVWHIDEDGRVVPAGENYGFISFSRDMEVKVTGLKPGETYIHWVNWEGEPFSINAAFFTNFYVVKDSPDMIQRKSTVGKEFVF